MASAVVALSTASAMQHKDSHHPPRRQSRGSEEHTIERDNDASEARKSPQTGRRSRSSRISEKWPVLYKLMRAKHSTVSRPVTPSPPIESEDEDEDEEAPVVVSFKRLRLLSSQPTYPKFPSPLSGICSFKRRLGVVRHNYIHRGYSQSALHAQRELWRKRKYEWEEYEHLLWQYGMRLEEIYGGIVEPQENSYQGPKPQPPCKRSNPSNAERQSEAQCILPSDGISVTMSNPAVFPRLGDLSSIRDPFLISVDTWFSDFPLWTLSKLIWIYDVHYRSTERLAANCISDSTDLALVSERNIVTSDVSSEYSTTTISTSSDATLVPDAEDAIRSETSEVDTATREGKYDDPSSSCSSQTICAVETEGKKGRGWETNWFLRWETLYHQVSLAIDLATTTSEVANQALDNSRQNRDATRIILTSPRLLYNPNAGESADTAPNAQKSLQSESDDRDRKFEVAQYLSVSIPNVILPADDEEEDYGDVITSSKYRLGAQMDPLSMFATAQSDSNDSDDSDMDVTTAVRDASHGHTNESGFGSLTNAVRGLTVCA